MADEMKVPGLGRSTFTDGHALNESYKMPSAHPAGKENLSYMHPHIKPLNLEKPWSSVDKTLSETARPNEQLSRSKTVFPVSTVKDRGLPPRPAYAKATRAQSHSPAPGVIPGPTAPTPH